MKYIVVGALGYIGSNFVFKLLNEGHEVIGIDKCDKFLHLFKEYNNFKFIKHNFTKKLNKKFSGDILIHLAALKDLRNSNSYYYEHNLKVTFNVLNFLKTNSIPKIIFSSSISVGLNNPYSKSKGMEEEILKDFCFDNNISYSILKITNPYGFVDNSLKVKRNSNNLENILLFSKQPIELHRYNGKYPKRRFLEINELLSKMYDVSSSVVNFDTKAITNLKFLKLIETREKIKINYIIKELN